LRFAQIAKVTALAILLTLAYLKGPYYLDTSFNATIRSDPQRFLELIMTYYGLLGLPLALLGFPAVLKVQSRKQYFATLVYGLLAFLPRATVYLGMDTLARQLFTLPLGWITLQIIRNVLQVSHESTRPQWDLDNSILPLFRQQASCYLVIGAATIGEFSLLILSIGTIAFSPSYVIVLFASGFLVAMGVSFLRLSLSYFPSPERLTYYIAGIPKSLRKDDLPLLVGSASFAGLLLMHIIFAAQNFGLQRAIQIFLFLWSDQALIEWHTVLAVAGYAILAAFLISSPVTAAWTNNLARCVGRDQLERVASIESQERVPLFIQDVLSTLVSTLLKAEFFIVIPVIILGFDPKFLLRFGTISQIYMLAVTAIFLFLATLAGRSMNRNLWLISLSIIVAPISLLFSASLEFFHVHLKRRLLRYYARFNLDLPSIVDMILRRAQFCEDKLLVRLMAFYGLLDEEIAGIKATLPGVRPVDFDSRQRRIRIHFVDRRTRKVDTLEIPLDPETASLMDSCIRDKGIRPNQRILELSKQEIWRRVRTLARMADIKNWYRITPFRLRSHFLIYVIETIDPKIRVELQSRKAF